HKQSFLTTIFFVVVELSCASRLRNTTTSTELTRILTSFTRQPQSLKQPNFLSSFIFKATNKRTLEKQEVFKSDPSVKKTKGIQSFISIKLDIQVCLDFPYSRVFHPL